MATRGGRTAIQVRVARVWVPPGRRPLDQAHVDNLGVSMEEIGQRTPIGVLELGEDHPQYPAFAYQLNAGGHRLAAHIQRGWPVIDAVIDDDDALVAKLAEVDENLIRRDLNALELAQALAARLEAWAARYPERATVDDAGNTRAKVGRPSKLAHGAPISDQSARMGFAADASGKVGISADTVKRALAVYRGIPAGLQAKMAGTPVASNPGVLRQLAAFGDAAEQAKVAEILISGKTKSVSDARIYAAGNVPSKGPKTPTDVTVKAFQKVWGAATPTGRAAILHDLFGRSLPKGYVLTRPANG